MAYPAGPLPSSGERQTFTNRSTPAKSVGFTHGTSDLDLTDPANGMTPCATEFVCTLAGPVVLTARLAGDSVDRNYTVGNGAGLQPIVRGLFTLARSSSTADGFFRQ